MRPALFCALRLAKNGWAGGDPERILRMKTSTVIAMIHHDRFTDEWVETFGELNKKDAP